MAKTKISEFSSTPGNNTDIDSINIAEGCAPSGINDAIRELMAQLKDFQTGAVGDSFNGPVGTTTAAAGAFTTLTTSSTVTLSGGTANGVAYLNGSKVLTTGSALTFDGTTFTVPSDIASPGSPIIYSYNGGSAGSVRAGVQFVGTDPSIRSYISGSEQMRLTSTGLGIGTSSPTAKLDVRGNATFTGNGTSRQTADFTNTGGQLYVGAESSSGGAVFVGSSAYAGIVGTNTNTPLQLGTNGTIKATLDSSGNLGLGVTPSAWGSGYKAIEFGGGGSSLFSGTSVAAQTYLTANAYFNGTSWIYKNTAAAAYYEQLGSSHRWYTAPSGTAGNAITFTQALSLTAAGNLLLGGTTDPGGTKVLYIGNGTTPGTPTSGGVLYVESGALKYKGSSGTVTTLGAA